MMGRRVAARWFGKIAIIFEGCCFRLPDDHRDPLSRFARRVARKRSQNSATPGSTFKDFHRLSPTLSPGEQVLSTRISTGAQQGRAADQSAQIRSRQLNDKFHWNDGGLS